MWFTKMKKSGGWNLKSYPEFYLQGILGTVIFSFPEFIKIIDIKYISKMSNQYMSMSIVTT